jgi:putative transposase
MSTYTQIIYHIVFSTKKRELTLTKNNRDLLYKYISGLLKNKKCHLYQINGIEDHLHIVTHIHPTVALSSLIKDIKLSSSKFIKEQKLFNKFSGWQEGYGAFTINKMDINKLIEYVKNQETHHYQKTFKEEFINLLNENEIVFDEKYML